MLSLLFSVFAFSTYAIYAFVGENTFCIKTVSPITTCLEPRGDFCTKIAAPYNFGENTFCIKIASPITTCLFPAARM